ncbi:MAG: tetratricopeptide repeat protein, partial [Pseudomonadota bacterium]
FFDLASALSQDDEVTFSISTVTMGEENEDQGLTDGSVAPDEIFKQLKAIMESTPDQDSPLFHYNLGLAYQRCHQLEEAMDEFTSSLNGFDNKAECYLRLIDCCIALKRLEESQDLIGNALKLPVLKENEKLELIYRSGLIYKAQGDTAKALKVFKKIYAVDKNFKSVDMEIKKLTP